MNQALFLDCPCTSFPRSLARDYKETYHYPPPSTLYGCLLSLIGETDLTAHLGVKLAMGVVGEPPKLSRILRKQRHHKHSKSRKQDAVAYPSSKFSIPNLQEILTDLRLVIKVDSKQETVNPTLEERITIALENPEKINRFGGLALGESWALVNGIRPYRETDGTICWLVKDKRGLISLPVWINRKTNRGTFQRFSMSKTNADFSDYSWITIQQPKSS